MHRTKTCDRSIEAKQFGRSKVQSHGSVQKRAFPPPSPTPPLSLDASPPPPASPYAETSTNYRRPYAPFPFPHPLSFSPLRGGGSSLTVSSPFPARFSTMYRGILGFHICSVRPVSDCLYVFFLFPRDSIMTVSIFYSCSFFFALFRLPAASPFSFRGFAAAFPSPFRTFGCVAAAAAFAAAARRLPTLRGVAAGGGTRKGTPQQRPPTSSLDFSQGMDTIFVRARKVKYSNLI